MELARQIAKALPEHFEHIPERKKTLIELIGNEFGSFLTFISIILDPISGDHKVYDGEKRGLFFDLSDKLDEASVLYQECKKFDFEDIDGEEINLGIDRFKSRALYTFVIEERCGDEQMETKYDIIRKLLAERDNEAYLLEIEIRFLNHCLDVNNLEDKLIEMGTLLGIDCERPEPVY